MLCKSSITSISDCHLHETFIAPIVFVVWVWIAKSQFHIEDKQPTVTTQISTTGFAQPIRFLTPGKSIAPWSSLPLKTNDLPAITNFKRLCFASLHPRDSGRLPRIFVPLSRLLNCQLCWAFSMMHPINTMQNLLKFTGKFLQRNLHTYLILFKENVH